MRDILVTPQVSIVVLGGALLLAIAIPFASVGPFRLGIWHQVEGVILGLHLAGALGCIGLVALARSGGRARVLAAVSHPLAVLPLALALWSVLTAGFVKLPGLSLFGAVETGEGAIWYFDLAILIAVTIILKRQRPWSRIVPGAATAATVAIAVLQLSASPGSQYLPYSFTDYLAIHGLFLGAILVGWRFPPIPVGIRAASVAILTLGLIWLSENRAAQLLAIVAGLAFCVWFASGFRKWPEELLRRTASAVSVAVAVSVTAGPFLVSDFTSVLATRARLFGVAVNAIVDHPASLIAGFGWGAVTDLNFEYLHLDTAALASRNAIAGPTGEMLHFHSHNTFLEAFLSAGMVGLCLSLAIVAAPPLVAARRMIVPAAMLAFVFAGVAAMWFQLAASLPLMAVAFAGLTGRAMSHRWRSGARRIAPSLVPSLIAVGALQAFGVFVQYDVARRSQVDPWTTEGAGRTVACKTLMDDYGRGGRHLAFAAGNVRNRLVAVADAGAAVSPEVAALFDAYICATDRWLTEPRLLQVAAASLSARTDLAFRLWDPVYGPLRNRALGNWEDHVLGFLDLAPERTDAARHYFYWRLALGDTPAASALAEKILGRRPGDPIGLWFKGLALSRDPSRREEARVVIVSALKNGATKMVDIDPDFLRAMGIEVFFPDQQFEE